MAGVWIRFPLSQVGVRQVTSVPGPRTHLCKGGQGLLFLPPHLPQF